MAAHTVTHAYGLSILCLLLSIVDRHEIALQFVWNLYHHWSPEFDASLAQGPLLALWRYSDRRRSAGQVPGGAEDA